MLILFFERRRLTVDHSFEHMAGPEHQHAARSDGNLIARLGVAAHALGLLPYRESSKRRQFDGLALGQCAADFFQHILDHLGRICAGKPHSLENRLGQVGAG